jgi:hypothetical protein
MVAQALPALLYLCQQRLALEHDFRFIIVAHLLPPRFFVCIVLLLLLVFFGFFVCMKEASFRTPLFFCTIGLYGEPVAICFAVNSRSFS